MKRSLLIGLFCFLVIPYPVFSQWDCRSILGAHLKPVARNFPLLWGIEATVTHGWMTDRNITHGMLFLGLDYSFGKHQFYFEGGYKGWRNSLGAPKNLPDDKGILYKGPFQVNRTGPRELFYRYKNQQNILTAGFHSITSADFFLVDERGFGVSFKKETGAFLFSFNAASVLKDYTRMGTFCGTKFLYNMVKEKKEIPLGNQFGETNFAAAVISWNPHYKKQAKESPATTLTDDFKPVDNTTPADTGEFKMDDEFKTTEETSDNDLLPKKNTFKINNTGLIFYEEFGSGFGKEKLYAGIMAELFLPLSCRLKAEVLFQAYKGNDAFISFGELSRDFQFSAGHNTSLGICYMKKYNISDDTLTAPAFSNLFMGEVMRLDVIDFPIINPFIKHNFPGKMKWYMKVQYIYQPSGFSICETDMETGIKILKHLRLTAILSRITANPLSKIYYMARFEFRAAF